MCICMLALILLMNRKFIISPHPIEKGDVCVWVCCGPLHADAVIVKYVLLVLLWPKIFMKYYN